MAKNFFWALVCSFIFLATACSSSQEKKERAELHLRIGTAHLTKGHYPQALQELLVAEELDPENETIQNNLGLAYYVRGEYPLAEKHLKKALSLNPSYSDAKNNLGRVYIEMGLYDSAIKVLTEVTKDLVYPSPEKAFINLGIVHMRRSDFQAARAAFLKSIEANNKFCAGYNYYGQALYNLNQFALAQSAFENALQLCKNNYDEAHYYSALSAYKLGQREKAVARFNEVIRLYPASDYSKKASSMLQIIK